MKCDVVVVGAGPAGAFLGYLLARRGFSVRILEKEPFPREKVCGGGISYKTEALLGESGIDIADVVHRQVTGCFLSFRNTDTVVRELGHRSGKTVLRAEFDALLLEAAKRAGAGVVDGCAFVSAENRRKGGLTVTSTRETLEAEYLVGADGVFSSVRRRCFGRGVVRYAPSLEALLDVPSRHYEVFKERALFDFGAMPRGYAWVFPKNDHLNVGVFSPYGATSLRRHLDAFISLYPQLAQHSRAKYRGFCIPLLNTGERYASGRVWLIGDAAGLAESFYGEGIYFALRSAKAAAEALFARFAGDDRASLAEHLRADGLTDDIRYSRLNAALFYRFQRFGFYHLVRNEHTNSLFAELLAGGQGHRECFYRTLSRLPAWALQTHSDRQINDRPSRLTSSRFYAPPNGVELI